MSWMDRGCDDSAVQERKDLLERAAALQAERDALRALLVEARDRIEGFYGEPGTNKLDRPLMERIDAALAAQEER